MILGHLAVADLAKRSVFRDGNFLFMAAAAYGPDLLDKTAKALFDAPSRGPGHSLTLFCLLMLAAWPFCRAVALRRRIFFIGAALWLSHLVCDAPEPSVLLWPFFGPLPPQAARSFLATVVLFYQGKLNVPILIGELVLISACLAWRLADRQRGRRPG